MTMTQLPDLPFDINAHGGNGTDLRCSMIMPAHYFTDRDISHWNYRDAITEVREGMSAWNIFFKRRIHARLFWLEFMQPELHAWLKERIHKSWWINPDTLEIEFQFDCYKDLYLEKFA